MIHQNKLRGFQTVLILFLTAAVIYPAVACRPQGNTESPDYAARIIPAQKKITAGTGERTGIRFELENTGKKNWHIRGNDAVLFSYHLLDGKGRMLQYDNRRFPLPEKVPSGQSIELTVTFRSPIQAGKYILEFDLLQEGITWFEDRGSPPAEVLLHVEKREWEYNAEEIGLEYGKYTRFHSASNEIINALYKLIRITLEENEARFSGKSGRVYGFSPGKDYPQIWLRDANTIIPASRFFYGMPYLASWLEEHLYYQKENGSLQDWINAEGESGKNTTETDQEASAVQAAYKIFQTAGKGWLLKDIEGKTVIGRLESALEFVRINRFSSRLGMVTGAHTADWGDVDMVDEGQEAVYADSRTRWTADIYDQAMFYQACLEMAEMREALGEKSKFEKWRQRAASLKKNTNRHLWQPDKGFYKVHLHLDSLSHNFDESNMFAMGGNAAAVLSGLAGPEKSAGIVQAALRRQKEYGVSTISGTLLPPYPENTFQHDLMDQPYEYQNGGQWDWFGGRLILAMFENGYSLTALNKLREIINKNIQNRGFFEWDTKNGAGRGSDMYCGSAGALSAAVIEGYFGIKFSRDSLTLAPKLGRDSGKIHVYQPAGDKFAAYDYRFDSAGDKITIKYNSNLDQEGMVRILLPSGTGRTEKTGIKVFIDGSPADFVIQTRGLDRMAEFSTDFRNRTAEILY